MIPTLPLANDVRIPTVGFGTYLIPEQDVGAAVSTALEVGYRHIDTAEGYRNETGVGAAIRDSGLSRDEVFVTTKLWPGNAAWGQTPKDKAGTLQAFQHSLERLGFDYVDLYLIHAPFPKEQRLAEWEALVQLKEEGRARAVGVSNYSIAHIEEIAAAGLPLPDANQIELHPWSQKPELIGYMRDHSILPIAYSSLIPLSTWRTAPGHNSGKTDQMKADSQREDSPFRRIADKHGVSEAQVLLRWAVQLDYAVLPKSTRPERIRQNFDLFSFELDEADMATLGELDRGDGVAWASGDPLHAP